MTRVLAVPVLGGVTAMLGSTLGGASVPLWRDNWLLMLPPELAPGASRSGGGEAEFGGAICGVGSVGAAGCGFCAKAGEAARISPVSKSMRDMMRFLRSER